MLWPIRFLGLILAFCCYLLIAEKDLIKTFKPLILQDFIGFESDLNFNYPGQPRSSPVAVLITDTIRMNSLHQFLDSLAVSYLPDTLRTLGHILLAAENPRLLNAIRSADYYRARQSSGAIIRDLDSAVALVPGTLFRIPDQEHATQMASRIRKNRIELNIPEFRIRLLNGPDTLCSCPVRVGRNERALLEVVGHEVDLRTPVGTGTIIRVRRHPVSVNLHTGEPYVITRRDDGIVTKMPDIPSFEPMLDGKRWGKMIHAATNQVTLGQPYSHGCVGVTEACMWTLYFMTPEGTAVSFRYDLEPGIQQGDSTRLPDIYGQMPLP